MLPFTTWLCSYNRIMLVPGAVSLYQVQTTLTILAAGQWHGWGGLTFRKNTNLFLPEQKLQTLSAVISYNARKRSRQFTFSFGDHQ